MEQMDTDLSACEKEPIHIPGFIQSFGALISFTLDYKIIHYSQNINEFFSGTPLSILCLIGDQGFSSLKEKLDSPVTLEDPFELKGRDEKTFAAQLHRLDDLFILEVEDNLSTDSELTKTVQNTIHRIQSAKTLESAFSSTVDNLFLSTGYDRIMIYKFHQDDHGEVVAEAKLDELSPFLGLHYPASDIPSQARALFMQSWVRMIPDVNYVPVPLVTVSPCTPTLNMSCAALRNVSPIHIEYLKNMKIRATLTISIIVEEKLWGLIACHHYGSDFYLSSDVRSAVNIIGRVLSTEIELRTIRELEKRRKSSVDLKQLGSENFVTNLFSNPELLLNFLRPGVTGAAAYFNKAWYTAGVAPEEKELNGLIDWLDLNRGDQPFFTTDSFPILFPEAFAYKGIACGIFSISIKKDSRDFLIWFKPEIVQTVKWAGNPDKIVNVSNGRIHPRKSFDAFLQEVKLKSTPWDSFQKEQALNLRTIILDLELQKLFLQEKAARQKLEEQKVKSIYADKLVSLGEIAQGIAHNINNPLAIITGSSMMLEGQLAEEEHDLIGINNSINYIKDASQRIAKVIRSLNFFVSEDTRKKWATVPIFQFIDEVESYIGEQISSTGCHLELNIPSELKLQCRPVGMAQVLMKLLSNSLDAVKGESGAWIRLDAFEIDGKAIFKVTDSGRGISKDLRSKIMDPFFTTKPAGKASGLGLPVAAAIIYEHKGRLYLDQDSKHTCFVIELPLEQE